MGNCSGTSTQVIIPEKNQVKERELDYVEKTLTTIYETTEEEEFDGLYIKMNNEYENLRSEWSTINLNLKSNNQ